MENKESEEVMVETEARTEARLGMDGLKQGRKVVVKFVMVETQRKAEKKLKIVEINHGSEVEC